MLQTGQQLTQFFETLDLENQRDIDRAQNYLTRFFIDRHKQFLLINSQGAVLASNNSEKSRKQIPFRRLKKYSKANYQNSLLYFFPDYARGKIYAWRGVDGGDVYFVSVLDENRIALSLFQAILSYFWVIALIVLFGILAIAFITIDMVTPIRHLVKQALAISKGDLREPVQSETWDELLYLSQALESVRKNFAEMAWQVKESAEKIEQTADFIAEATNQEASGVVEYASSINEVLATLEELSATAKHVSENAAGVSNLSEKNLVRVEGGHQLIRKYLAQSERIEKKFRRSLDHLEDLHKRIQDISQI
jgi:methyl-accepting chemotaxis protein